MYVLFDFIRILFELLEFPVQMSSTLCQLLSDNNNNNICYVVLELIEFHWYFVGTRYSHKSFRLFFSYILIGFSFTFINLQIISFFMFFLKSTLLRIFAVDFFKTWIPFKICQFLHSTYFFLCFLACFFLCRLDLDFSLCSV